MTATGWRYSAAYRDDVNAALVDLQRDLLATGDFEWPEGGGEGLGAKPTTYQELLAAHRTEAFWLQGTHSILDMDRVLEPDAAPSDGAIRGMSPEEIAAIFDAARPTRERFDAAYESGRLPVDRSRWAGRWLALWDGTTLSQLVFWGASGD